MAGILEKVNAQIPPPSVPLNGNTMISEGQRLFTKPPKRKKKT